MPEVKRTDLPKDQVMMPDGAHWNSADKLDIQLQPTPVSMQPSEYIRSTLNQVDVGAIKSIQICALHDGSNMYLRLEWEDADKDDDVSQPNLFPDGAAVMFPFGADAPLITMGSESAPVNQWHWQAGLDQPYNVTTAGLATTYRTPESYVESQSLWADGRWKVVLSRPLQTGDSDNHVDFVVGQPFKAGFCVWEGSNSERAGVKAFTVQWTEFSWEV